MIWICYSEIEASKKKVVVEAIEDSDDEDDHDDDDDDDDMSDVSGVVAITSIVVFTSHNPCPCFLA